MLATKPITIHISRFMITLALAGVALGPGCYDDDLSTLTPPYLAGCRSPDEWAGANCEQICNESASLAAGEIVQCTDAKECGGEAARGFKRLDACGNNELEHSVVLEQGCEEPFPESLTESVYFVSCCCAELPQ